MPEQNQLLRVRDYLTSRFPQREYYATGVALAVLSSVAGNSLRVHLSAPIRTKSNLYVLLCGKSGTGKTSMIDYGLELLESIQYKAVISDDITPELFPRYFSAHPYSLMRMSEISELVGSYKKKGYKSGLREALIRAYDGTPLQQGRTTSAPAEAKNYSLCAIADTQPEVIAQSADATDVSSGFLPRFMWMVEKDPPKVTPRVMMSNQMSERTAIINELGRLHLLASNVHVSCRFSQDDVDNIATRIRLELPIELLSFQPFVERLTGFAYKLAMIHHFSDSEFEDEIQVEKTEEADWTTPLLQETHSKEYTINIHPESVQWAIEFVQKYMDDAIPRVIQILNLNDGEKVFAAVKRYHDENEGKPMPEALLYRSIAQGMKDFNRMRVSIQMACSMHLVFPLRRKGGRSYALAPKEDGVERLDTYDEEADED